MSGTNEVSREHVTGTARETDADHRHKHMLLCRATVALLLCSYVVLLCCATIRFLLGETTDEPDAEEVLSQICCPPPPCTNILHKYFSKRTMFFMQCTRGHIRAPLRTPEASLSGKLVPQTQSLPASSRSNAPLTARST